MSNRVQYVSINGIDSNKAAINIGVPQGSVLGPLLFLLYINDILGHSKFFTILFTDDTTFQTSHKCLDTLTANANKYLAEISNWVISNRLTLNAKKNKYMIFVPNGQSPPLPNKLTISGVEIERLGYRFATKSFKLGGILLDDNLDWREHARHVRNKIA